MCWHDIGNMKEKYDIEMNRFMFHMEFISFIHIQPHIRILNNTTWWLIGNISRYSMNLNDCDLSSNTYSTLVMNQTLVKIYWKRRNLFLYHFKTDYFFLTWLHITKLEFVCSNTMYFMINKDYTMELQTTSLLSNSKIYSK